MRTPPSLQPSSAFSSPGRRARMGQAGFTMVELITVIVLVGILSAIIAGRFFERESFDARAFADQLASMLRFGQKLAVAQNRPVYVRMDSKSFALCFNGVTCSSGGDLVNSPSGGNSASSDTKLACANNTTWYCEGIPSTLSVTMTPVITGMYFDALGRPFLLSDPYPSKTSSFTGLSLKINSSKSGSSTTLLLEQETGYVHQ